MTPLQSLLIQLQAELFRLGKIPAPVRQGSLMLNMHEGELAVVQPTYYGKIEKVEARVSR